MFRYHLDKSEESGLFLFFERSVTFFFLFEFIGELHCLALLWCHDTYVADVAIAIWHTPRLPSKGTDSGEKASLI